METEKYHFRHITLFCYRKGKDALQVRKKLSECQHWSTKLSKGNCVGRILKVYHVLEGQLKLMRQNKGINGRKPTNGNS